MYTNQYKKMNPPKNAETQRQWYQKHKKPMIVSEYGADTIPGMNSVSFSSFSHLYGFSPV